jgi:hypothetical protein
MVPPVVVCVQTVMAGRAGRATSCHRLRARCLFVLCIAREIGRCCTLQGQASICGRQTAVRLSLSRERRSCARVRLILDPIKLCADCETPVPVAQTRSSRAGWWSYTIRSSSSRRGSAHARTPPPTAPAAPWSPVRFSTTIVCMRVTC